LAGQDTSEQVPVQAPPLNVRVPAYPLLQVQAGAPAALVGQATRVQEGTWVHRPLVWHVEVLWPTKMYPLLQVMVRKSSVTPLIEGDTTALAIESGTQGSGVQVANGSVHWPVPRQLVVADPVRL